MFQVSNAQDHVIQGIVHTLDSVPLTGVEIYVRSTKQSFYTDSTGRFTIMCEPVDKLKIQARGFFTQTLKVKSNIKLLAVNLKPKPENKQRMYSIGFGNVTEADRSNAVSSLNDNDTDFTKYNNMYDLIRANFSGVQVRNGEILIRGASSFNSSSTPLVIVDGAVSDYSILDVLSPLQIKKIDIIKDGTTAVYGSRGANGVILIETKKGGE